MVHGPLPVPYLSDDCSESWSDASAYVVTFAAVIDVFTHSTTLAPAARVPVGTTAVVVDNTPVVGEVRVAVVVHAARDATGADDTATAAGNAATVDEAARIASVYVADREPEFAIVTAPAADSTVEL
jgi:hypothetical protein